MKVYKPGEHHKTWKDLSDGKNADKGYIYVNVFLWDSKWEKPKYNGTTMSQVGWKDAYCLTDYDIKYHYSTVGYKLKDDTSYTPTDNNIHTVFRAYENKSSGKGTVTVKDRFGNEYSSTIQW